MKPNFALTLSFEGIGLLHRAFPGWHLVGEVALDSPDLAGALAALRDKAQAFDPSGLRSKLVLPNDQIRYLQIDADGLGPEEIADAVARALDGATPYAIEDLAYDWSISAGQVYIAAVARETLNEAEAFAADHGFNPLGFVAVPGNLEFVGEPWFGETKTARDRLPVGGFVERDTAAVRVIGAARLPDPPPLDEAEDTTQHEDTTAELGQPDPDPPVRDQTAKNGETETIVASDDLNAEPAAPVSVLDNPVIPDADFDVKADTGDAPAIDVTQVNDVAAPQDDLSFDATIEPVQMTDASEATLDNESVDAPDETSEDEPAPETELSFSSIRASRTDEASSFVIPKLSGARRDLDPPMGDSVDPAATELTIDGQREEPPLSVIPPTQTDQPQQVTGVPEDAISDEVAARIGASLRPLEEERLKASVPEFDPMPDAAPIGLADEEDEPPFASRRDLIAARSPAARSPEPRAVEAQDEQQRMTIFGAREPLRVGGKPRFLGIMLTAALLIFLVGVAAWASIFLDDGLSRILRSDPDDTTVASLPNATPDVTEEVVEDLIEEEPEFTLEPGEFGTAVAALPSVTTDAEDPARDAVPDPRAAVLSPDDARARYAVTGIWQLAPDAPTAPQTIPLEDFYLTSIDPQVTEQDAVALPDVRTFLGDTRLTPPLSPPAAETTFALDARGLVRAVPEGAFSPDGIAIYAGAPRLVPPQRPDAPQSESDPGEGVATVTVNPALARLAAFRPRNRPGDLAEQYERSTLGLGGRTRTELAGLRPKLRPQSEQELAQQAAAASTAAVLPNADSAAVEAAIAAIVQTPDPLAGATAQAVSTSRKPKPRPNNFARIVQRSQREQTAVQTAAVVPSNQRVVPRAPTATTVARAATDQNALKLRRVNLIGVFGSPSDRRALVRLANGRYKKVKIGDRLDGGKVAAIGDSELRYVKGGRSLVLQMPRG